MRSNIKLIKKLEEQAKWHNQLMLYYARQKDGQQQSDHHAVASMSFLRASQIARVIDE